jgi:hypothetical protein
MVGGNWVVVVGKGEDRWISNVEMLADINRWLLEDEVASTSSNGTSSPGAR